MSRLLTFAVVAVCSLGLVAAGVDPDTFRSTTDLIKARGYTSQISYAHTADGYYLDITRIPNAGKPAVLLQHGLMDTAATWVINDARSSLGYILHDQGYDVFMCNSRGNKYSNRSDSHSSGDSDFWDFSFDEHALGDVPACIAAAKSISGRAKISYIGHSQGSSIMFAALSKIPSLVNSVNLFVALAPVTFMRHQGSSLMEAMAVLHVDAALGLLPHGQFVPTPSLLSKLLGLKCLITPSLCNDLIGSLFGSSTLLSSARMGVYLAHWPDLTSRENIMHWIQNTRSGNFADMQGTRYSPSLIDPSVPIAIYFGSGDYLGDYEDVTTLANSLSGLSDIAEFQGYTHMDFVWSTDAATNVYPRVLAQLAQFNH